MEELFTNEIMLQWLKYYADNVDGLDIQKVKIIDITRKNKNLIPTVESHKAVLVFTEAGHPEIFYKMWDAGLGECECWYNVGSDPSGEILHKPVKEMIDRGINASAAMLFINKDARSTYKVGIDNAALARGSVHYVGSEIRAIILRKMHMDQADTVCVISGASIVVEAALIATEGTVIAVEYSENDRRTVEDNANKFGLRNVEIIDHVDDETMKGHPVPSLTMLVASASMEQEIECLLKLNPDMEFVIYTLDFKCAAELPDILERYGLRDTEVLQLQVSKLNNKRNMAQQPVTWLVTSKA